MQDFLPKLKDHILTHLLGHVSHGIIQTYTKDEHDTVEIIYNQLYKHKAMRVNYTTYDMWREQDTINPRTRPDIMLMSHEDEGADSSLLVCMHPWHLPCQYQTYRDKKLRLYLSGGLVEIHRMWLDGVHTVYIVLDFFQLTLQAHLNLLILLTLFAVFTWSWPLLMEKLASLENRLLEDPLMMMKIGCTIMLECKFFSIFMDVDLTIF